MGHGCSRGRGRNRAPRVIWGLGGLPPGPDRSNLDPGTYHTQYVVFEKQLRNGRYSELSTRLLSSIKACPIHVFQYFMNNCMFSILVVSRILFKQCIISNKNYPMIEKFV